MSEKKTKQLLIGEDLHTDFKLFCIRKKISLTKATEEAVSEYMQRRIKEDMDKSQRE